MAEWEYRGVTYHTRHETIKDSTRANDNARKFPIDYQWEVARAFCRFAILTTIGDKPAVGKPIEDFNPSELVECADAWSDDDPDVLYLFYDAVERAKQNENPKYLRPGAQSGNSPALNEPNS